MVSMPRLVLSLADWQAVAHELAGTNRAIAPPGLIERVQALLAEAPQAWPDQPFALELDASCIEAVRAVHATLTGEDRTTGQQMASVAEAIRIIHDHQQHD
jgi:hypothetical protein